MWEPAFDYSQHLCLTSTLVHQIDLSNYFCKKSAPSAKFSDDGVHLPADCKHGDYFNSS
jgi:hypothetical protein